MLTLISKVLREHLNTDVMEGLKAWVFGSGVVETGIKVACRRARPYGCVTA